MKNKINKTHAVEDGIIALNGEIAERKRAEARVNDTKKSKGSEQLTASEDETLEELQARLARKAKSPDFDQLTKSLKATCTNFLRRRARHRPETLAKSLSQTSDRRLVLPRKLRG